MTGCADPLPVLVLVAVAAVVGAVHGDFADLSVYSVRRPGGPRWSGSLRGRRPGDGLPVHLPAVRGGGHGAAGPGPDVARGRAVDRVVRRRAGGCGRRRTAGARPARAGLAGRARDRRGGRPGAGVAEPRLRTGQRAADAGGPGRSARTGAPLVRRAGRHRGGPEADPARVRRAPGPGRTPCCGRTGGCCLRSHRGGRLRRDAERGDVVLDRRPRRREPGRAAGAGPQPVGLRRTQQVARRPPAHPAVARRRGAARSRDAAARGSVVARRRPGARRVSGGDGHARRLADLVVAPLGVGGAGRPRAVGAQPLGGPAWVAVFVARPVVWPAYGRNREYDWGPIDHLVGNAYLLAAVALAVWAAVGLKLRTQARGSSEREQPATHPGPRPRRT